MNEVLNNIQTRRSVRSFQQKQIPLEDLKLICDAARFAPSGMNFQSWRFTVVQDKQIIKKLADVVRIAANRDEGYNFYMPDTLILCSNDVANENGLADCACAMENIMLAAHSLGIGSVWINQFKNTCDTPDVRKALTELKIPENHNVWAAAALGYADGDVMPKEKRNDVVEWFL